MKEYLKIFLIILAVIFIFFIFFLSLFFIPFIYKKLSNDFFVYQKIAEAKEQKIMIASWYSREFCLNCRKDRIMANGKPLNDNAPNCATREGKLNSTTTFKYKDKIFGEI